MEEFDSNQLQEKLERLKSSLRALGSAAVAFSSGVDSTFLLKVAHDTLGEKAVAVTACSYLFPGREREEARQFCGQEGIRQIFLEVRQLEIGGFSQNPPNRCYLCKKDLFSRICRVAEEEGLNAVIEGSNLDDLGDYRPGLQAIAELGVRSPLRENGFTKQEIRELSRRMGLPTWSKPSFACLASRFVYGETLTEEKLARVEQAEQFLLDLGFSQMRVRVHGDLARIEVPPAELSRFLEPELAERVNRRFRELGFLYAAVDLGGYQTGSMNRALHL